MVSVNEPVGCGEVPLPGRVAKPILQGIAEGDGVRRRDRGDFDARLEHGDLLDQSLVQLGLETFLLIGSLDSDLGDFLEERLGERCEDMTMANALQAERGSEMLEQVVPSPIRLKKHMGDVRCASVNFREDGATDIATPSETKALQFGEVDTGGTRRWGGMELVEKGELLQFGHWDLQQDSRPCACRRQIERLHGGRSHGEDVVKCSATRSMMGLCTVQPLLYISLCLTRPDLRTGRYEEVNNTAKMLRLFSKHRSASQNLLHATNCKGTKFQLLRNVMDVPRYQ